MLILCTYPESFYFVPLPTFLEIITISISSFSWMDKSINVVILPHFCLVKNACTGAVVLCKFLEAAR